MNPLSVPIIIWNRTMHLFQERRRIAAHDAAFKSVRKEYERAKKNGMPHYERMYNVGLYVLLLDYDIATLKNDALFAIREKKRNYVARQLAVLLYESSHDIPELLGKEFRASLKTLPLTDEDWKEFNEITKQLNAFKEEHQSILNRIRNYVGAHRDKNAGRQIEILESIELLEIMNMAGNFYIPIRSLISFMTKVTLMMGKLNVIIKHMPPKGFES